MSNENTIDYNQAMEQLHKTTDELRKISRNKHQVMPVSPYCSFCSKGKNEVKKMLKGPNVHICNECVRKCQKLLNNKDYDEH